MTLRNRKQRRAAVRKAKIREFNKRVPFFYGRERCYIDMLAPQFLIRKDDKP